MKILSNYVVAGALYQGGTGPEAQVGDQLKLFLDMDAEPGFPEFIFGTILNPISKVECGSSTNYRVEYNEADLLGAAALLRAHDIVSAEVFTAIDAVESALSTETAARITADTVLQEGIDVIASDVAAKLSVILSVVAVSGSFVLDAAANGKLFQFAGGETVTLPPPIVGLRCWLEIGLGGEQILFAGTLPTPGGSMATNSLDESYGVAELEGCPGYWLLKQVASHTHARSELEYILHQGSPTTVANLPSAVDSSAGARTFVTDSNASLASAHGNVVAGGGSNFVPVFSDGTNWIIG